MPYMLADTEEKIGVQWDIHQIFIDLKKVYDSVRRVVPYNIFIEFGVPMKLAGLIKIYLNEAYSGIHICNRLSDNFPIQNGLKRDVLSPLLFKFALESVIREVCRYINTIKKLELMLVRRLVSK
jgi:hypothetical protein